MRSEQLLVDGRCLHLSPFPFSSPLAPLLRPLAPFSEPPPVGPHTLASLCPLRGPILNPSYKPSTPALLNACLHTYALTPPLPPTCFPLHTGTYPQPPPPHLHFLQPLQNRVKRRLRERAVQRLLRPCFQALHLLDGG